MSTPITASNPTALPPPGRFSVDRLWNSPSRPLARGVAVLASLVFIALSLSLSATLLAQSTSTSSPPLKLGIASSKGTESAADILLTALSGTGGLEFVERTDLDLITREKKLQLASFTAGSPSSTPLAAADILVLLEHIHADGRTLLSCRAVGSAQGLVLVQTLSAEDPTTLVEWGRDNAQRIRQALPKLRVPREKVVALSLLNLRVSWHRSDPAQHAAGPVLKELLARRLESEPELFVLEREAWGATAFERQLVIIEPPQPWTANVVLDGSVALFEKPCVARIRLTSRGGASVPAGVIAVPLPEVQSLPMTEALAGAFLKTLGESGSLTSTRAPPWAPAEEGAAFMREALAFLRMDKREAAHHYATMGWEMGARDDAAKLIRLKTLQGISSHSVELPGFITAPTGLGCRALLDGLRMMETELPPPSIPAQPTPFQRHVIREWRDWFFRARMRLDMVRSFHRPERDPDLDPAAAELRAYLQHCESWIKPLAKTDHPLSWVAEFGMPLTGNIAEGTTPEAFQKLDDLLLGSVEKITPAPVRQARSPEEKAAFSQWFSVSYPAIRRYEEARKNLNPLVPFGGGFKITDHTRKNLRQEDAALRGLIIKLESSPDVLRRTDAVLLGLGLWEKEEILVARHEQALDFLWEHRQILNQCGVLPRLAAIFVHMGERGIITPQNHWDTVVFEARTDAALRRLEDLHGYVAANTDVDHSHLADRLVRVASIPAPTRQRVLDQLAARITTASPTLAKNLKDRHAELDIIHRKRANPGMVFDPAWHRLPPSGSLVLRTGRTWEGRMEHWTGLPGRAAPCYVTPQRIQVIARHSDKVRDYKLMRLDPVSLETMEEFPLSAEMMEEVQLQSLRIHERDGKTYLAVAGGIWELDESSRQWRRAATMNTFVPHTAAWVGDEVFYHGSLRNRQEPIPSSVTGVFRYKFGDASALALCQNTRNPAMNEWDDRDPYKVITAQPLADGRVLGIIAPGNACAFDPATRACEYLYRLPVPRGIWVESGFHHHANPWATHVQWDVTARTLTCTAWNRLTGEWRLLVNPGDQPLHLKQPGGDTALTPHYPAVQPFASTRDGKPPPYFVCADYDGARLAILCSLSSGSPNNRSWLAWWSKPGAAPAIAPLAFAFNRITPPPGSPPGSVVEERKRSGDISNVFLTEQGLLFQVSEWNGFVRLPEAELRAASTESR